MCRLRVWGGIDCIHLSRHQLAQLVATMARAACQSAGLCGCSGYLSVLGFKIEQQFLLASSAESGCHLVMTMHLVTIVWNQEML